MHENDIFLFLNDHPYNLHLGGSRLTLDPSLHLASFPRLQRQQRQQRGGADGASGFSGVRASGASIVNRPSSFSRPSSIGNASSAGGPSSADTPAVLLPLETAERLENSVAAVPTRQVSL